MEVANVRVEAWLDFDIEHIIVDGGQVFNNIDIFGES
jgi:hypothetical protein